MFILTQAALLNTSNDNIYRVQDEELEKQYLDAGYQRFERSYKVKEQHKEFTVICPEFRNDTKDVPTIVIIPEFLVPGRPYPVYVYLYAINLYSSAPEKGQRQAAEETRKFFGLRNAQILWADNLCPYNIGAGVKGIYPNYKRARHDAG